MLKSGDIVFFKKCTRSAKRRSPEIGFKGGNGFAIMLGIVPPFQKEPVESQVLALMGSVGFLSFDDVVNFLGEELGKECCQKFEEKYNSPSPASQLILPINSEEPKPIA